MKNVWLFLTLFLFLIIEATVLSNARITGFVPNLVLVGVVMAGLLRGTRVAVVVGVLIGMVQDVNYGSFLGETAVAYALAGYAAGFLRSLVMRESVLLAILVTGITSELFEWVTYGLSRFFGAADISVRAVAHLSSSLTLVSMGFAIIAYWPFKKLFSRPPRVRYDEDIE